MARVLKNERITAEDHFQDTRHIEVHLGNSGLVYLPGDLLAVFPQQHTSALLDFLHRTGLDPEEWVKVEAADSLAGTHRASIEVPPLAFVGPVRQTSLSDTVTIFGGVAGSAPPLLLNSTSSTQKIGVSYAIKVMYCMQP